jgi:hypothetical protein
LNRMLVLVLVFTTRTSSENYFSRNSSLMSSIFPVSHSFFARCQ